MVWRYFKRAARAQRISRPRVLGSWRLCLGFRIDSYFRRGIEEPRQALESDHRVFPIRQYTPAERSAPEADPFGEDLCLIRVNSGLLDFASGCRPPQLPHARKSEPLGLSYHNLKEKPRHAKLTFSEARPSPFGAMGLCAGRHYWAILGSMKPGPVRYLNFPSKNLDNASTVVRLAACIFGSSQVIFVAPVLSRTNAFVHS